MTDLDVRLWNWARVVREAGGSIGSAGSFEGRYRSPQHWEALPQPSPLPLTGAQIRDGWEVEAAMMTLSRPHRVLLRSHYCHRIPAPIMTRILRRTTKLNAVDYLCELSAARFAIDRALHNSERKNRNIVRELIQKTLAIVSGKSYKEATT